MPVQRVNDVHIRPTADLDAATASGEEEMLAGVREVCLVCLNILREGRTGRIRLHIDWDKYVVLHPNNQLANQCLFDEPATTPRGRVRSIPSAPQALSPHHASTPQ